jgi:hypothetical protein
MAKSKKWQSQKMAKSKNGKVKKMAKSKKWQSQNMGLGDRSLYKKKSYMCTSTKTKISTKTKNLVYVLSLYTILNSDMLHFTVILVLFVLTENIKYIFL